MEDFAKFCGLLRIYELYCHFLKTSIFEPLCFLKWCPIFDSPFEHLQKSNKKMIFILLIFCKNILPVDSSPQNFTTRVTLRRDSLDRFGFYFSQNLGGTFAPLPPTALPYKRRGFDCRRRPFSQRARCRRCSR